MLFLHPIFQGLVILLMSYVFYLGVRRFRAEPGFDFFVFFAGIFFFLLVFTLEFFLAMSRSWTL